MSIAQATNYEQLMERGFAVRPDMSGWTKILCPNCSHTRKKKGEACLRINMQEGSWHCFNCGFKGSLAGEQKKKHYVVPEYTPRADMSEAGIEWFRSRGITEAVLARNRITDDEEFMPGPGRKILTAQFPYFVKGRVVNIKFRGVAEKTFKMVKDAELTLYKWDDMFTDGNLHKWIAIVEGEMDALALEVAGIKQTVSVPNGAQKGDASKFEYLDAAMPILSKFERVRIAVDNDEVGIALERELVRRIGFEKCLKVVWPEGCKDANDVLVKHGAHRLRECVLDEAQEYPQPGIVRARDLRSRLFDIYRHGREQLGVSTGWSSLDPYYRPVPGQWSLITAMPNIGKSPWIRHMMVNIALSDGWKFGLWAPEDDPIEDDLIQILQQYMRQPFFDGYHHRIEEKDLDTAIEWLDERFFWIQLSEDEEPTLDILHERAQSLVATKGINGLLFDPFNEIDISVPAGSTFTREISGFLKRIRMFSRKNDVHTWLVAHPRKLEKIISKPREEGAPIKVRYPVPTPYDVAESAHFRNKADVCIALDRDLSAEYGTYESRLSDIYIQKMKKKRAGRLGKITLEWDSVTGRYLDLRNTSFVDTRSRYEPERVEPQQSDLPF